MTTNNGPTDSPETANGSKRNDGLEQTAVSTASRDSSEFGESRDAADSKESREPKDPWQGRRLLIKFAVHGDLRFISHRDTMRLFVRAIVRADFPVAYTQGFNPHVKVSILVPRPVGVSSAGDLAVVHLKEHLDSDLARQRLDAEMPAGAEVVEITVIPPNTRPRPQRVAYSVDLPADICSAALPERIAEILSAARCVVDLGGKNGASRQLDVRPFLTDLQLNGAKLSWDSVFVDGRDLTPRDLCTALRLPWGELRHKILRESIELT